MSEGPKSELAPAVRAWLPLLAGVVVVLVTYAQTLEAPFLWDDKPLLEMPAIAELKPLREYLTTPFWDRADERGHLFYRPVATFSLALDHAVHGTNAAGFHLTNLILHVACMGLVYALARRYGATALSGAAAATLWALAPRFTESVAWISGRTDQLCALFTLGAWLAYQPGRLSRSLLASLLAVLALFSKEAGIAAVLAVGLAELLPRPSLRRVPRLLPLVLLSGFYFGLRHTTLERAESVAIPLTGFERVWTVFEAIGRYVWMIVDAWHPASQIGVLKSPSIPFIVLGAVTLVSTAIWALRQKPWRASRPAETDRVFAPIVGLLPLLLVIHLVPMPWLAVAGDRLLYLPLAALAASQGFRLNAILPARRLAAFALVVVAASFAITTRAQAAVYTDSSEFWVTAVETTPRENWGPSLALAGEYLRAGLFEQALALVESTLKRPDPTGVQGTLNLTHIAALTSLGKYAEAEAVLRASPEVSPDILLARARVLANQYRIKEALDVAREMLARYPSFQEGLTFATQLARVQEHFIDTPPPAGGADAALAKARFETRLGRRREAAAAWLNLLGEAGTPKAILDEAMAFLVAHASFEDLRQGGRLYRRRGGDSAVLALTYEERLILARRLRALTPRVERALRLSLPHSPSF